MQNPYKTIAVRKILQSKAEQNRGTRFSDSIKILTRAKCNKNFRLVSAYFLSRTIFQSLLHWQKEGDPRVEPAGRTAWVVAGVAGIVKIKEKKIEP